MGLVYVRISVTREGWGNREVTFFFGSFLYKDLSHLLFHFAFCRFLLRKITGIRWMFCGINYMHVSRFAQLHDREMVVHVETGLDFFDLCLFSLLSFL